jgi:hypothetical protein
VATLNTYLTQVQRLLHDANNNFYTPSQLTDYINEARQRTVRDTGALREVVVTQTPCMVAPTATIGGVTPTYPLSWTASTAYTLGQFVFSNIFTYQVTTAGTSGTTAPPYPANNVNNYQNYPPSTEFFNGTVGLTYVGNCENISYAALTYLMGSSPLSPSSGNTVLDVLNINLYWGNTRVPLDYLTYTDFNARLRFWQNYIGRPLAFSVYGQQQIYIGPVPDQIYQIEVDCVVLPNALSLNSPNTTDVINDPYSNPVQFYAAYLAKYYEQSYGEAEIYKQEYIKHIGSVINTVYTRRIPSVYSSTF